MLGNGTEAHRNAQKRKGDTVHGREKKCKGTEMLRNAREKHRNALRRKGIAMIRFELKSKGDAWPGEDSQRFVKERRRLELQWLKQNRRKRKNGKNESESNFF